MRSTYTVKTGLVVAIALGLAVAASAQDTNTPTPIPETGTQNATRMPGMRDGGMALFGLGQRGEGMDLTPEERAARIAERFAAADTDADGLLSADEIAAALEAQSAERRAVATGMRLQALDMNGDGALSLEELTAGPSERMFARADTNGDGMVSPEEWDAAMAQMRNLMGDRMDRRAERRTEGRGDGHGPQGRMGSREERRGVQHRHGG